MPKTNYLADKIGDHMHGGPDFTRPATTYFAAFTTAPTVSGTGSGVEVSGGSYARVAFTNNSTNWPASAGQTKTNAVIIDFGAASAPWGTIVALAEFDASSGGNMLTFALLSTPRTVGTGDPFFVPVSGGTFLES